MKKASPNGSPGREPASEDAGWLMPWVVNQVASWACSISNRRWPATPMRSMLSGEANMPRRSSMAAVGRPNLAKTNAAASLDLEPVMASSLTTEAKAAERSV